MAAEISLCMIVKYEEDTRGRCLAGVRPYVAEIVIAGTGSTDQTVDYEKKDAEQC